jgi:hypothetical protein
VTDVTHSLRTIFGLDAVPYSLMRVWAWRAIRPTPAATATPAAK